MVEMKVNAPGGEYPLVIGPRAYEDFLARDLERADPGKIMVVSHPTIFERHGHRLREALSGAYSGANGFSLFLFDEGEENKTMRTLQDGYLALIDAGFSREDMVLAFGGGVVGDLAGFLAATYMRGVGFVQLPTTLMAMVDSSIGGKVGVDLPNAKNAIGAFHQPRGVYSDVEVLSTLPERELRSGLVEVVKYAMLYDEYLMQMVEGWAGGLPSHEDNLEEIIARCAAHKARVVAADERDTAGIRAMLNYGHTFGHALESAGGYGLFRHGEAVGMGMIAAARLSELSGLAKEGLYEQHIRVLEPVMGGMRIPEVIDPDRVMSDMQCDKKKGRELRFVLLERPQVPRLVEDIPKKQIRRALVETLQEMEGV
jgi:3-dehydroquinate synthase